MRKIPTDLLKLGDRLDATVVKPLGGRRFQLSCSGAPRGWKVELHTLRPELIQEGAHIHVWVTKLAPMQGEMMVQDGDFGRLPISAAMLPRYLSGLRAAIGEGEATGEALADARSMFQRITKRQQADWLTVWQLLDEPPSSEVKAITAAIEDLRNVRKEAPEKLEEMRAALKAEFGDRLVGAIQRLERLQGDS